MVKGLNGEESTWSGGYMVRVDYMMRRLHDKETTWQRNHMVRGGDDMVREIHGEGDSYPFSQSPRSIVARNFRN